MRNAYVVAADLGEITTKAFTTTQENVVTIRERSIYGTINRFNNRDWHDDWLSYNEVGDNNRRIRERKIR